MTLINSPAFVCFVVVLALLLGFLLGGRWQRRAYDAVWRDGASWAVWRIRSHYDRLPRKLKMVLKHTDYHLRSKLQQLTKAEMMKKVNANDFNSTDRTEADTTADN